MNAPQRRRTAPAPTWTATRVTGTNGDGDGNGNGDGDGDGDGDAIISRTIGEAMTDATAGVVRRLATVDHALQ